MVYTFGEYKFFHEEDFGNTIRNLPKSLFFLFLRDFQNAQISAYKNVNCGDSSFKKNLDKKNCFYL